MAARCALKFRESLAIRPRLRRYLWSLRLGHLGGIDLTLLTRKPCYRKDGRAMRPKISGVPGYANDYSRWRSQGLSSIKSNRCLLPDDPDGGSKNIFSVHNFSHLLWTESSPCVLQMFHIHIGLIHSGLKLKQLGSRSLS